MSNLFMRLESLNRADLLELQRNNQLAEIKKRDNVISKAYDLAKSDQLPIDIFEGPSIEWRDTDLLDMPILHCPLVNTKVIIMLHRLWIAGLLGIRVDNLPMLTIVIAMNLRTTDNMEADLLVKEVGTVNKGSIPIFETLLVIWLSQYNLLLKDLPEKIPAYFNDFIPEDREEWVNVKDVTSVTKEGEVLPQFTTKDKKFPMTTYLSMELVAFINKLQQHDPQIPIGEDLCHYFMWTQGQETIVQSACASFLALCTLRLIGCHESTVIENLKSNFLLKFGEFYHKETPQKWISTINHDVISELKKILRPGKTAVTTVMVPILATYLDMMQIIKPYSDNDKEVLEYGILRSTCYIGLFMALIFEKVATEFNDKNRKLTADLWAMPYLEQYMPYLEQYKRMAELSKMYITDGHQDRALWAWSRVLQKNYLSKYSSKSNQWICALLTSIYIKHRDHNIWSKKCFEGMGELLDLAWKTADYIKFKHTAFSINEGDSSLYKMTLEQMAEIYFDKEEEKKTQKLTDEHLLNDFEYLAKKYLDMKEKQKKDQEPTDEHLLNDFELVELTQDDFELVELAQDDFELVGELAQLKTD